MQNLDNLNKIFLNIKLSKNHNFINNKYIQIKLKNYFQFLLLRYSSKKNNKN